jgi:hypothetical protein
MLITNKNFERRRGRRWEPISIPWVPPGPGITIWTARSFGRRSWPIHGVGWIKRPTIETNIATVSSPLLEPLVAFVTSDAQTLQLAVIERGSIAFVWDDVISDFGRRNYAAGEAEGA